jgi:hypothetical protein
VLAAKGFVTMDGQIIDAAMIAAQRRIRAGMEHVFATHKH